MPAIDTLFFWPLVFNPVHNNATLDGTTTKRAFIFTVPKSGTIDRISFGVRTMTTSQTLRVGLQTLDASGVPSGTQYGGSGYGTKGSLAADTTYEVTLGTPATATVGDQVAIVIEWDSTTGSIALPTYSNSFNMSVPIMGTGYNASYAGSWAKSSGGTGGCSVRYNDGTYALTEMMAAGTTNSSTTFNNGSTPDEKGNRFTAPFAMSICGAWVSTDLDGDASLNVYDDANNVIGSKSLDADIRGSNGTHLHIMRFAETAIAAAELVRVVLRPDSATSIGFRDFNVLANAHLAAIGGTYCYGTQRTDAGSWTDTDTQVWPIGLIVSGVTASGGGLITHPGMVGGLRG